LNELFQDKDFIYKLVLGITSIGVIISGMEWLSLSAVFKDENLFSWKIRKTRTSFFIRAKAPFDYIYGYPYIIFLVTIQVFSALGIMLFLDQIFIRTILCGVISIISIFFSIRAYMGHTGADQMFKLTFITVTLSYLSNSEFALKLGLIVISIHLIIAYATPGLLRIFQKEWRNGEDLLIMLRLNTYGNFTIWQLFKKHKVLYKTVTWGIILFECSIIIALFLPINYLLCYLLLGILFHLSNAIIMGLNTFTWAFVGTYPAYLWLSCTINN
jgi:hypothetical protein